MATPIIQQGTTLLKEHWVIAIAGTGALYILSNYFQKGLYRVPGPWLRKFSSLPRILSVYHSMSHEDDIVLHQKYGKIVRLAPNLVSITDTAEINQLYGIGTKFIKSDFYQLSTAYDEEGLIPDTFVLTNKELHTRMKKNAANAYSLNGLVQMEPWIEPVTVRLLKLLGENADKNQAVDMAVVLKEYAMDAVFALTFGKDFNYVEKGDVLGMFNVLELFASYMAIFGQIPWVHKFMLGNPLVAGWYLGGSGGEDRMFKLAASEVEIWKETTHEDGPMTFLQRLLLNQKKNPDSINDREVMTHAFGNISAGSDTTATAMRSILFNVLKHPEVYRRLCEEVRSNLSLPVGFVEANKLPYLSAVIQEGIRMHPSVGMLLARYVPAGGATICGYKLAAGTEVGMNPWVLHRDPEVFPDPNAFWPDRWMPSVTDEDHLKRMNRSFFAFGHGAHTCSGRWISTMEVTKLIPTLLLEFDMSLVDGGKDYWFKNRWFTLQNELKVKFTKRKV